MASVLGSDCIAGVDVPPEGAQPTFLQDEEIESTFGCGEKVRTVFLGARKHLIGFCVAVLAFTFSLSCSAQEFNLMPWPARIEQREGFFKLVQLPRFEVKGGDERVQYAMVLFSPKWETKKTFILRGGGQRS